jgi:Fe-S-cluster containining protein
MLKPKGLTRDLGPFRRDLKCCTFQPVLPSFTLGALLIERPARLHEYLMGARLTPLGAFPRKDRPTSICETGRHEEDRCPFLSRDENPVCGIHDHRPSTCAAYVCSSVSGASGLRAWSEWERKLAEFEMTLAHLVAFDLGYTLDDVGCEFKTLDEAVQFYERAFAQAKLTSV